MRAGAGTAVRTMVRRRWHRLTGRGAQPEQGQPLEGWRVYVRVLATQWRQLGETGTLPPVIHVDLSPHQSAIDPRDHEVEIEISVDAPTRVVAEANGRRAFRRLGYEVLAVRAAQPRA